ncbi:MAG TPA: DNA alkylation repair protein [Candidatus Caccousia stercoris]|uniref:DNA alkylation repair protein n=1 Tax=Candidatus Caccousia stercoris TaxID=2840723 RepID=A0A9D1FQW0_9FIRM|nr:DNA alkylation repair protein [Candidatus Caccousia stercoris]
MEPVQEIRDRLFALQDPEYRLFQSRLMPTVDPARVIGVRTPDLRKLSRELAGTEQAAAFVRQLPHDYYEENNLHGLLIASLRDYGETVAALESFLPHVDNWATCDLLHPRAFDKRPEALPDQLFRWLQSDGTYTVRFAMGMLMSLYLDEAFRPRYADWVAGVKSEEYYVNMMAAWYFATALAKRWDDVFPYLTDHRLPVWTHNKAIQKAIESRRISPEQKQILRSLKR